MNFRNQSYQIVEKHLIKTRKVKTWTQEEDKLLKQFYETYEGNWNKIGTLIEGRNANQCLHRYRRIVNKGTISKKIWSQEEDLKVSQYMKVIGKNWKLLSQKLKTKTGKQIRERFINKLNPEINRNPWTQEEDFQIINLYKTLGTRWSQISKNLIGRPENMVKNRFYIFIMKNYEIKDKSTESKSNQKSSSASSTTPQTQKEEIKFPSYTTAAEFDDDLCLDKPPSINDFDEMFYEMLGYHDEPPSFASLMWRDEGANILLD